MATKNSTDFMDATVEDYYRGLDAWLQRYRHMNLARWKLLQNTAISLLVVYLAAEAGADPTAALAVLALINGISFADLASIWGVSVQLRGQGPPVTVERGTGDENKSEPTNEDAESGR